jgi:DNA repair and recombination protein RAD54B
VYGSDFVNPGLLESYATFRKEFETPILKSRQPGVSKKDVEKGKGRSDELSRITAMFVLRRTSEILSGYLPPKSVFICALPDRK